MKNNIKGFEKAKKFLEFQKTLKDMTHKVRLFAEKRDFVWQY